MNQKQVACIFLLVGIVVIFQVGVNLRKGAADMAKESGEVAKKVQALSTQLAVEKTQFADIQKSSQELIDFVEKWRPYFEVIDNRQEAETNISMRVREANMLNLSQRYQQVPNRSNNKDNATLPVIVRASLTFDDAYSRLLNWIGEMERAKPTMRVGRVALSKGSRGEDLRMDAVLELPLKK